MSKKAAPFSGRIDEYGKDKAKKKYKEKISNPDVLELSDLKYHFNTHFHPYAQQLIEAVNEGSVAGLQAADTESHPELLRDNFRVLFTPGAATATPYPVENLDFGLGGGYSVYNWELFYHVPLSVAIHLSRNGRYEEAMQWFHYIFDPADVSDDPSPERFWKVQPLKVADVKKIEELLVNLSTNAETKLHDETVISIAQWRDRPFRPHLIARIRQTPYMYKAVMSYLDNLVDWGDSLFRQDTGESINEATQLYVMAANILGPRPQAVPRKGWQRPQSYAQLRNDLNEWNVALRELEADIPFDLAPPSSQPVAQGQLATLRSIGMTRYFGVPRNDKLLGYWDTVADRLFKIRNSLNLQGIFRQLPLFEPPIDPALLARAAAAGLDIGAVIAGLNQPLPLVRFGLLLSRAAEICQEVKSLGGHLLSAMEKHDNEQMALLRTRHEKGILGLVDSVKYSQWQEAIKAREGIEQSLANAKARYVYFERQLGKPAAEILVPDLDEVDQEALKELRFQAAEPVIGELRPLSVSISKDLGASGGKIVSKYEAAELRKVEEAHGLRVAISAIHLEGAIFAAIPDFETSAKPMGVGAGLTVGGVNLSRISGIHAAAVQIFAEIASHAASRNARLASYARRELEWAYQSNNVAGEIMQIFKQLRAAQIREAITKNEWDNHQQQMANAQDIEDFLKDKTTNSGFYVYLKREVRHMYSKCFEFAYDIAKKAERALQYELGDTSLTYLSTGYLSGREGLLAGEKLYLDIKRMEMAYHELNKREYELTTHVSLRKLDPVALMALRATGSCTVTVPEDWYDLDCPGHYFRRIKSVAVSIPCVAGPYATVNCTVTQLKSSVRTTPRLDGANPDAYVRTGDDAERFSDHFGSLQSIVTSAAQNDSGMFETNLRDERYLPFEGSGAISQWQLALPHDVPQFDHQTITDVVLHIRYTAREGGEPLRGAAVRTLRQKVDAASAAGSVRLLSMRQEFPSEWAKFTAVTIGGAVKSAPLTLRLRPEHYPYWTRVVQDMVLHEAAFLAPPGAPIRIAPAEGATITTTAIDGDLRKGILPVAPPAIGEITCHFSDNTLSDLWLMVRWGQRTPP